VVCPPAGHFLNGLASGFNMDIQESNDPWFKAGQIIGMGLFIATLMTGPEDPLADAAALRLVSRAPKAAELIEGGAKEESLLGDVARACSLGRNSFSAGTLVLMADGSKKPIEDIKVGDKVEAGDPKDGTHKSEPVQEVIVGQGLKHLYDVHVEDGVIEATYNHPFWVTDTQTFVWAEDLEPGEHLLLADGRAPPITSISHHDEITTVYNLSVTDIHTFYVGDESVLVHNSCENDIAVIGHGEDALAAKGWAGHEVLDLPGQEWTMARNDQWVQSVVDRRMSVYVASTPTWDALWNAEKARPTVFSRELKQFVGAGYKWDGWYLRPPSP
jgi:hypothetical protein